MLGGGSVVTMVQAAQHGDRDEFAFAGEGFLRWRLPAQSLMRARGVVVVVHVLSEQPLQNAAGDQEGGHAVAVDSIIVSEEGTRLASKGGRDRQPWVR